MPQSITVLIDGEDGEREEVIEFVEDDVTCIGILCKLCSCISVLLYSDYFYKTHLL